MGISDGESRRGGDGRTVRISAPLAVQTGLASLERSFQAGECGVWEALTGQPSLPESVPGTARFCAFSSAQQGEAGAGSAWPVEVEPGTQVSDHRSAPWPPPGRLPVFLDPWVWDEPGLAPFQGALFLDLDLF